MRCRPFFTIVFPMGAALALMAPQLIAQNTCHIADSHSEFFIKQLQSMMGAGPGAMQLRTRFNLPLVPVSEIVLVSDSTICARAGAAADSMMTIWDPTDSAVTTTASIYVVQIGTSYAMADLNAPPEYQEDLVSLWIFGPLWEYRGMLAV